MAPFHTTSLSTASWSFSFLLDMGLVGRPAAGKICAAAGAFLIGFCAADAPGSMPVVAAWRFLVALPPQDGDTLAVHGALRQRLLHRPFQRGPLRLTVPEANPSLYISTALGSPSRSTSLWGSALHGLDPNR